MQKPTTALGSKKTKDSERAKRILAAAREHETDNDPASFERVFSAVVHAPQKRKPSEPRDK